MKKLKNTTQAAIEIEDVGFFSIPAQSERVIDPAHYLKWARSTDVVPFIDSGDIVVNDGIDDLPIQEAKDFISHDHKANAIRFDPTNTSFSDKTLQKTTENLCNGVGSIWTSEFGGDALVNDEWAELNHTGLVSNETPDVVVFKSKLIGASYSNSAHTADFDLKLYGNNEGDGAGDLTEIWNWVAVDARVARKTDISPDVIVNPGDKLALYVADNSKNSRDLKIKLYWMILEMNSETSLENYTDDFVLPT